MAYSTRWSAFLWLVLLSSEVARALSSNSNFISNGPSKILVTGASGKTGKLVFSNLLQDSRYEPMALVRSETSAKKLIKEVEGCELQQIIICDVTTLGDDSDDDCDGLPISSELSSGMQGMVICTSAVPKIRKRSLLKVMLCVPWNFIRRKKLFDFRALRFKWQANQYPELVDYHGQVSQIKLAKKLGMEKVVLVSSMGGTQPDNPLNRLGKDSDGNGNGDILLWKRKAEVYLTQSGLDYVIIHPGGLTDKPAGDQEIILDVDDKLIDQKNRSISRGDVANLVVASLGTEQGTKVSLDCISAVAERAPRSLETILKEFLATKKSCTY